MGLNSITLYEKGMWEKNSHQGATKTHGISTVTEPKLEQKMHCTFHISDEMPVSSRFATNRTSRKKLQKKMSI